MEPFQEQFVVHLNAGIANGGQFMTVPARNARSLSTYPLPLIHLAPIQRIILLRPR